LGKIRKTFNKSQICQIRQLEKSVTIIFLIFFGGVLVLERFVSSVELKATSCNIYI